MTKTFTCPKCNGHSWEIGLTLGDGTVVRKCLGAYRARRDFGPADTKCQFSWHQSEDHRFMVDDVTPEANKEPELERCEISCVCGGMQFQSSCLNRSRTLETRPIHKAINFSNFAGYEYEDGTVWVTPWRIVVSPFVSEKDKLERAKYVLFRRNT